jgi:hypothetical protein
MLPPLQRRRVEDENVQVCQPFNRLRISCRLLWKTAVEPSVATAAK